jgi:hypothetical protein
MSRNFYIDPWRRTRQRSDGHRRDHEDHAMAARARPSGPDAGFTDVPNSGKHQNINSANKSGDW